jgi:hypothetical protein
LRICSVAVALTLVVSAAIGQVASSELSGMVTAPGGLPLSDVTVRVNDRATGFSRTTLTSAAGRYAIAGLRPARYDVRFERSGLNPADYAGVELLVGQTFRLNATLYEGIVDTIMVTAQPQLVDVTSSEVGGTLTASDFRDLPTQNRNFVLFAALLPGVIPNPQTGSSSSDALYVNGQHQANNSFRVDGARNDDSLAGSIGGAEVRTAIEAIQEFEIVTSQFDAEIGGATGGVLNAITKSGTNEVRGSLFSFFQDAQWNSPDYFTKQEGLEQPDASFRSAGFTVGGPIIRGGLHYFASFEQALDREGHTRFFASRPSLSFATTEDNHIRNLLGRADYEIAQNHHLSVRYLSEEAPQFRKITTTTSTLDGALEEHDFDVSATAALDSAATASRFNTLRVSYTHNHFVNSASPNGEWASDFDRLRTAAPGQHRLSVDEGPATLGQNQRDDSTDVADTASWLVRAHELHAGFQWARRAIDVENFSNANGRFDFDTDRPFDPNDTTTYPVSFAIRVHGSSRAQVSNIDVLGLFVQDHWRLRNDLTLNAGLRWDRDDAVHDRNNFAPRLGVAWSPAGSARTVIRAGAGRFYDETRLLQWSQYLLDAAQLTDGVAVRVPDAGTNRQYFANLIKANGITSLVQLRDLLAQMISSQTSVQLNLNPTVDNPGRVSPYVDNFTLGLHHELTSTLSAGIDLVHSESRKTLVLVDLNPFSRAQGGRPNISVLNGSVVKMGSIGTLMNVGNSRYSAVQLSMQKRMRDSVSFRFGYTYSDSSGNYGNAGPLGAPNTAYFQTRTQTGYNFDTGQIIGDPLALNLDDPRNAGQPVGWQRRHNFVAAGVWRVPHTRLSLSSVYRYMSGNRYTISTTDLLDNGNRAPDGTLFGNENPDFSRMDASARYALAIPRGIELTLIADVFNVMNRTNFVNAGGMVEGSPGFLVPTATFNPREFQFGARMSF